MMSAGRAALNILLQNAVLLDGAAKELVLYVVEAQTVDGVGTTLAGQSLIAEEEDGALHHIQHLLIGGKDLIQGDTVGNLLTPASADGDLVAVGVLGSNAEGALALTATAVAGADEWAYSPQKTISVCKKWAGI